MNRLKSTNGIELIVSTVLQIGVLISSAVILAGIILLFISGHQDQSMQGSYHQFATATYSFPHSISGLQASIRAGQGIGYIELGVLLLILTPILRVATSIMLFLRRRDRPMMLVTLFVFVILVGSFVLGLAAR